MKRWRHYKKDTAVLLAAFGSISEKDRYERLKTFISEELKEIPVYMAFSSRSVLKRLAKDDIHYKNLPQVMADLDLEGYRRIVVSSINLYPTDEHELIQRTVEGFRMFCPTTIRCTGALFSKAENATDILHYINSQLREKYPDDILLYLIHGAPYFEQAGMQSILYTKEFLKDLNPLNFFASLERVFLYDALKYSLIRDFIALQKESGGKRNVRIVPMLLASGTHLKHDVTKIIGSLIEHFPNISLVDSLCGSENFNLLDIDIVRKTYLEDISIELKKLK